MATASWPTIGGTPRKRPWSQAADDDQTKLVGIPGSAPGASPHNLLADTLGDELKLATQGKARVFGIALKDRASVLPAGFAANGAYWIDRATGAWITSTYYRSELPRWAQDFNDSKRAEKYLNQEWKDSNGNVLRSTRPPAGKPVNFYDLVGSTPLANDYEFEFARELITYEKLGSGPATDLLIISLSANDILGHKVGPDSAGDAGHGAGHGPPTGRLLRIFGTPDWAGQRVDCALGRSWNRAPAPVRGRVAPSRGERFRRQDTRTNQQRSCLPGFPTPLNTWRTWTIP